MPLPPSYTLFPYTTLFRSFRVNPYGDPEDDWLDLDRRALASAGYKVNRRQIIGKVEISSILNPGLVDQTNREGIRDSEEKQALRSEEHTSELQSRGHLVCR